MYSDFSSNNSESLDAITSDISFNSKFKNYWRESETRKINSVPEHILISIGRVCGNIGITGLPTSVRTVGCGLDARVLSTLLVRAVPLTRQEVRAAFCVVHKDTSHFFGWCSY